MRDFKGGHRGVHAVTPNFMLAPDDRHTRSRDTVPVAFAAARVAPTRLCDENARSQSKTVCTGWVPGLLGRRFAVHESAALRVCREAEADAKLNQK